MIEWRVTTVQTPATIWARYADAVGLDVLHENFGANWPPSAVRPLESVYCWRDASLSPRPFDAKDHPAAWLSLAWDQFDDNQAWMSRGVWPDQHGQGLGRLMRDYAENLCRTMGAHTLKIQVAQANAQHFANVTRDPYWKMAGVLLYPVIYIYTHEVGKDHCDGQDR
jgi:GNAT superfamily N-acetyltransferase